MFINLIESDLWLWLNRMILDMISCLKFKSKFHFFKLKNLYNDKKKKRKIKWINNNLDFVKSLINIFKKIHVSSKASHSKNNF